MLALLFFRGGGGAVAPVATQNTPGRVIRHDWWKGKTGRIEEQVEIQPDFEAESRRVREALSDVQRDIALSQKVLAELEAQALAEGIRRTRNELARIESQLLEARQQAQKLAVMEAVLREELEVIDIAFLSVVVLNTLQ